MLKGIDVNQRIEFISKEVDRWADEIHVTLDFSKPGTPKENPYV
jgi:putative transposase